MPFNDLPKPKFIATAPQLKNLVATLSPQPCVAVDTEANSLYAYQERVCLIQFSIPGSDYLVDPLAIDDLSPLAHIFENSKIEKIFHAVEYDLIILQRDFGFQFCELFDTMVAARILGWKAVGLRSILKDQFGVTVNKKYQRADWGKRPIPREMLTYAQLDTHFLIELRDRLKKELQKENRWELAREDFERSCQVNIKPENKPVDCWRINGVRDLKGQQIAILHELCQARDRLAQALDRPLFKVINDKALVHIAEKAPQSINQLEQVPGVTSKQARWIGRDLLTAIERGRNTPPPKRPRTKRPSDAYLIRVENLRQWRKNTAINMGVESDVVLPKDILYDLAEKGPRNPAEFEAIMRPIPWRLRNFGDELYNLIQSTP